MRATAGAFRERRRTRQCIRGYALLGWMLVLFGLILMSLIIAPNLVLNFTEKKRDTEQQRLMRIADAFDESVQRRLIIPSHTNWIAAVTPFAGMDDTMVQQVNTDFSADTNLTRVFLIDPNMTGGLLPYTQTSAGLTGSQTNLLGPFARVMLISDTKRNLTLPVTSGVASSSNAFYAIWNWVYDPLTKAPPSSWPAIWNGNGQFLHVHRINLANFFHVVTLNNLLYGMSTNTMTNLVTSQTAFHFLRGTPLALAATNGTLKRLHVVNRDIGFDFGGTNSIGPIAWWKFSETSGTVATNSGSLGAYANGAYLNGVTLNVAGPRLPTFPGFTTNNIAVTLDGSNDYVRSTNGILDNVSAFTIAGWVKPAVANFNNMDLFGQLDVAGIGFTSAGKVELWCDTGAKKLNFFYPYGAGAWHHLAGVGDGINIYLYLDGALAATRSYPPGAYGSSGASFNIGAKVFSTGNYFNGSIDEVIVYDRALSAAEIALLVLNQAP